MQLQPARWLLAAVVPFAFAQQPAVEAVERVFRFEHAATGQQYAEIATTIRSVLDIPEIAVDEAARTLTLRSTAVPAAAAEWLFRELDQPAEPAQGPGVREYRMPGADDDVIRVFYLAHAGNPRDVQEMATTLRAIADIRRLFTYSALKAVTLRDTAEKVALAEWLVSELDQSPDARPGPGAAPREHRFGAELVEVCYLPRSTSAAGLQETAVQIRKTAGIRRIFTYNAAAAIAMRGTPKQLAQAGRIVADRTR